MFGGHDGDSGDAHVGDAHVGDVHGGRVTRDTTNGPRGFLS